MMVLLATTIDLQVHSLSFACAIVVLPLVLQVHHVLVLERIELSNFVFVSGILVPTLSNLIRHYLLLLLHLLMLLLLGSYLL